jgi:site-specific DNA-methyltransferase (adenine-specific)
VGSQLHGNVPMTILVGDCRDVMATMDADSVDAVVTDPPAGIAFMAKSWDSDKGGRDAWVTWLTGVMREAFRVAKPGAHAVVWALPRTSGWTHRAIEDAGWEIRDCITHHFGSGFPKSLNVGDGRGTALKPATEFWYLARKPLIGTVAANVERYGTGAINVDACRIGTDVVEQGRKGRLNQNPEQWRFKGQDASSVALGRWPANIVLSHSPDCRDGVCVESCPVALLDAQSGETKSTARTGKRTGKSSGTYGAFAGQDEVAMGHTDQGGASRFFLNTSWQPGELDEARFFYAAKASRRERNAGLAGMPETTVNLSGGRIINTSKSSNDATRQIHPRANHHPTVKPVALMRWLVRLVTPPNGLVLDPFTGSGTTGCAASLEGFRFIGIEQSDEYADIARRRIAHVVTHGERWLDAAKASTATPKDNGVYAGGKGRRSVPRCPEHDTPHNPATRSQTYKCGCRLAYGDYTARDEPRHSVPPNDTPTLTDLPLFAPAAD